MTMVDSLFSVTITIRKYCLSHRPNFVFFFFFAFSRWLYKATRRQRYGIYQIAPDTAPNIRMGSCDRAVTILTPILDLPHRPAFSGAEEGLHLIHSSLRMGLEHGRVAYQRPKRINGKCRHPRPTSRPRRRYCLSRMNLLHQGLQQYDLSYDDVEALVWSGVLNQRSQARQMPSDLRLTVITRI